MELELFSDLFICPYCNYLDTGKFCSNCGKPLKIDLDKVANELSKRYEYVGFIPFQNWLSANQEAAEYHKLFLLHPESAIILCKEYPPNNGLHLEILILFYEQNNAQRQIKALVNEYVKYKRQEVKRMNRLPRNKRPKMSASFLEKLEFRLMCIKPQSEQTTIRKSYKKVSIHTLTGTFAGGLKRILISPHFLRSSFNLLITVDLSLLNVSTGKLLSPTKKLFDIVQHQAQIIARQTLADPTLPEKKPNKLVQLLVAIIEGFREYFIILAQYVRNPSYFPEVISEKRGIPLKNILGLYFVGLICSITIPWALSGGYLNSDNLSLFSNLPPFVSDLAELGLVVARTSIVCIILHLVIRLSGRKGSFVSLLLCFLFYESFMQIIERPVAYLTGPFLLRLTNNNFYLQYPVQLSLLSCLTFISAYFIYPILYSVYKASRRVVNVAYICVIIFFSAWIGFFNGFFTAWNKIKFGQEIDSGGLQVFYRDSVTLGEAQKLQRYLVDLGFGKENAISMQILKHDSVYILKEVVKSGAKIDPDLKKEFSNLAFDVSVNVFYGSPVKFEPCNRWFNPIAEIQIPPENRWVGYHDASYSIRHPLSWKLNVGGKSGSIFFLYSEELAAKISCIIDDSTGQSNLDAYIKHSIDDLKTKYPTFKLLESSKQTTGQHVYQILIYNIVVKGDKIRIEQYILWINNKAYILTFGVNTKDLDENTVKIGESIMNTFNVQ